MKATLPTALPQGNPCGLHRVRSDIYTAYSLQLILWPLTVQCAVMEHPLIRVRSLTPSEVIPVGSPEQNREIDWPVLRMWSFCDPAFPLWCFAEKWSMHVCECKRLPMWTDVRMSIRSSLTWLQGTDSLPSAIAPAMTGESHSHPLAHGKTGD